MKTNLPQLMMRGIGGGKTEAICKAAKEIGAIVVVHSAEEKNFIAKHFGVKCVTFDDTISGLRGCFLVDTYAVSLAAQKYEKCIEELKEEINRLREKVETTKVKSKRKKIEIKISVQDLFVLMAEGNPGALSVLCNMDPLDILTLDDMNIRGPQIWVAYKDHCNQKMDIFTKCVRERNKDMINTVNAGSGIEEVAVVRGASWR